MRQSWSVPGRNHLSSLIPRNWSVKMEGLSHKKANETFKKIIKKSYKFKQAPAKPKIQGRTD